MASYSAFAAHYDYFCENVNYPARAKYFDAILTKEGKPRGLLLDLACGTGSLSCELSSMGYDVIAVDASPEMLAIAREKTQTKGQSITLLNQRMENLDLYGTVDNCVCALDSINHITTISALRRAFKRVALFLVPGGRFVFDANTPYKHQKIIADNAFVFEKGDTICVWQNRTQKLITHISLDFFTRVQDNKYLRMTESFYERAYPREELEKLLNECDFDIEAVFGDDTLISPNETTERYIFVTKRK
jgi:ubiquinone/menaquinone biosynthesis C-methylase UbiE